MDIIFTREEVMEILLDTADAFIGDNIKKDEILTMPSYYELPYEVKIKTEKIEVETIPDHINAAIAEGVENES